ncbi:MAG TPA: MBL fold metallo-hydrolase [Anaerolineae bacterium]|nr:MBL fold metallo-hydrolase [Anaerolineae bacterium]
MQLTWLGAAGFKVDTDEGATLLIDPYLARLSPANASLPLQLADLFPVDEIFLTDGRLDHIMDTPALAQQTGAIVHAPEPVCQQLVRQGVPAHHLESTVPKIPKRIGSLSWQALSNQAELATAMEEEVAYFFKIDGLSLIHFSSLNWLEAELGDLHPHLALLPLESDPDNSNAAAQLASLIQPQVVIPHYGGNYSLPQSDRSHSVLFETALKALALGVRVYRPAMGQSFNPIKLL